MSEFRTPVPLLSDHPQDMKDGLNFGNVMPRKVPSIEDWVKDEATKLRAQNEIYPLLTQAFHDRQGLEDEWDNIRRMGLMQHDQNQAYIGKSNVYLPLHAKNVQTKVTQLVRALFPTDEYMDATIRGMDMSADKERSKKAKIYMQYELEIVAKIRYHMRLFCKQLEDYGWSILKYWYRKPLPYAKAKGKKLLGLDDLAVDPYGPEFYEETSDQGLTVSTRSIFNFWAYPFTAATLRETTLHCEAIILSVAELAQLAKQDGWYTDEIIKQAPRVNAETVGTDHAENMAVHNVSESTDNTGSELGDMVVLKEVYTFLRLPNEAYTDKDGKDCPLPVRILFLGDTPVSIKRISNYSQSSPFLGLSTNASPGFLIGHGSGKMIAPLQYLSSDIANQINDVCIYGLNPGIKAVPGMLIGGLRPLTPGGVWYMNDINAVDFFHPPVDQLAPALQVLSLVMGQAQDFGGSPPVMQGTAAGKNAKTATGAQLLQHNASEPLQDITEDIQNEVLVPLCSAFWKLAQQHAPQKLLATVFGLQAEITKDDLLFDAEMQWRASSQAANAQQRAAQAMQFVGQLAPFIRLLGQQGVKVNLLPLFQKIYSDAMGFRGFEEIFQQLDPNNPAHQMEMMKMMGQGAPGGEGTPPGEEPSAPGSFTEQAAGGPAAPMQQGEGQMGAQVRDDSEAISAMLGGQMGGF